MGDPSARHPGAAAGTPEGFTVVGSVGAAPFCEVRGQRLDYRRRLQPGPYAVGSVVEIRRDGEPLVAVESSGEAHVLDAGVMRAGLEGTALGLPLTLRMPPRGLLRRHRHVDIALGEGTLRFEWARRSPVLVRGGRRGEVVMRATGDDAYELLGPVSDAEELVAVLLALGGAREAIRNPLWGLLEAILNQI